MRKAWLLSTTMAPRLTASGSSDIVAGSAEYDVAALKGLGASFLDHNLLAAELDGLARRARAR